MKKGQLSNGFKYEIDETKMDDMEFLDALAEARDEDPVSVSIVIKKLLGKEQRKAFYDHIREEDGRVPVQKTMDALNEMFDQMGDEGKN